VSPAKTAAPIELPFGLRTWVGPGNHVLGGRPDPPRGGAIFRGNGASHCTRVVQQVPGLMLYFTQQQMRKNYYDVISQHTLPTVQYNLPSAQQVA